MADRNVCPTLFFSHYAESEIDAARGARIPVSIRAAGVKWKCIPGTAAADFDVRVLGSCGVILRRLRVKVFAVPVAGPFPDIAEHVVQGPRIWLKGADLGS